MTHANENANKWNLDAIEEDLGATIGDLLESIGGLIHRADGSGVDTLHSVVALRLEEKYNTAQHIIKIRINRVLEITDTLIEEANRRRSHSHRPNDRCPTAYLVELLTGCWLALYFLGVPFPQPWEAVLFFVQRLGFPRGASASKAIGDTYRERRLCFSPATVDTFEAIHVLDLNPLTISDKRSCNDRTIKSTIAKLGRYYEFLQLRLYIRSGAPLQYSVPDVFIKNIIKDNIARQQRILEMWTLLHCCFNSGKAEDAHPLTTLRAVSSGDGVESLPACVLAPRKGIYRTRSVHQSVDGVGPPGNFLPRELLENYRERLIAAHNRAPVISKSDEVAFGRICEMLVPSS